MKYINNYLKITDLKLKYMFILLMVTVFNNINAQVVTKYEVSQAPFNLKSPLIDHKMSVDLIQDDDIQIDVDDLLTVDKSQNLKGELVHRDEVNTQFNRFLQVHFSDYNLKNGYLKIYSEDKPEWFQLFDETSIENYQGYSAVFSSEKLIVELYAVGDTKGLFFEIDKIQYRDGAFTRQKTICGSDNRVLSSDPRVARMFAGGGCTAWLMSNGTVLTAGHCADGPLGAGVIIEFDVPLSNANGSTNPSAPQDQFVIDHNNVSFENQPNPAPSCNPGRDWAIMRVFPNATTGLMPAIEQGDFFRPTVKIPTGDIRITGFGVDSDGPNQNNRAQQTHSDDFDSRTNNGANGIFDNYETDTEGANSGSPVIRNSNQDFTYGIHICGGCNATTTGTNTGTSFDYNPLQIEMSDYWSTLTIHVDKISDYVGESGSIFSPFDTVEEAEAAVTGSSQHNIILVKGTYNEVDNLVLDEHMLIHAPVGNVLVR